MANRVERAIHVLRDQIIRHKRGQGKFTFPPVQLTTRGGIGDFNPVGNPFAECHAHTHARARVPSEVFGTAEPKRSPKRGIRRGTLSNQ